MPFAANRRDRLMKLLEIARITNGWTKGELAKALGRDVSNLGAESGNPKFDYMVALARALDWTLDDVSEFLQTDDAAVAALCEPARSGFDAINAESRRAMERGQFDDMLRLARDMYKAARTPEERAIACNREFGAWDRRGRFTQALEAIRRGLEEPVGSGLRYVMQSNLAMAYYRLGDFTSGYAIAHIIIDGLRGCSPDNKRERGALAYGFYIRGMCVRAEFQSDYPDAIKRADQAFADLTEAAALFDQIARDFEISYASAVANTARLAAIEVEVELGRRDPHEAVELIFERVPTRVDPRDWPCVDWLESFGWACTFCANISLRHFAGSELQRAMAVYTNKALEFAEPLNNWALREQVFSMQFATHQVLKESSGLDLDLTIDEEDIKLIAGTMGRFRRFRDLGVRVMETAKVVKSNDRN